MGGRRGGEGRGGGGEGRGRERGEGCGTLHKEDNKLRCFSCAQRMELSLQMECVYASVQF